MKNKKSLTKIGRLLKWSKMAARFAAVSTTIVGAITAFASSSAASTGLALGAAGATSFAATKSMYGCGYEQIKHIPPSRASRESREFQEMEWEPLPDVKAKNTISLKQAYKNTTSEQKAG